MTLNPIPSHPSSLCYVLKLHRDSQPVNGRISGLLEHVATGHSMSFEDAEGLVEALAAHAAREVAQTRCQASGESP